MSHLFHLYEDILGVGNTRNMYDLILACKLLLTRLLSSLHTKYRQSIQSFFQQSSTSLKMDADDNISFTSTLSSIQQDEYEVDQILAERVNDGETEYLTAWANYPETYHTWEPRDMFNDEETFTEWKEKKSLIAQNVVSPFDVLAWEARCQTLQSQKAARKKIKGRKRREAGLQISSSESSSPLSPPPKSAIHSHHSSPLSEAENFAEGIRQLDLQHNDDSSREERDQPHSTIPISNHGENSAAPLSFSSSASSSSSSSSEITINMPPLIRPAYQGTARPGGVQLPLHIEDSSESSRLPQSGQTTGKGQDRRRSSFPHAPQMNVAVNWDKQPNKRIKRNTEGKHYKNLSHRNNANKSAKTEREPDIDKLVFIDTKTGRPIGENRQRAPIPVMRSDNGTAENRSSAVTKPVLIGQEMSSSSDREGKYVHFPAFLDDFDVIPRVSRWSGTS